MAEVAEFKAFKDMGRGFTDGYLGVEDWNQSIALVFGPMGNGVWQGDIIAEPGVVEVHLYNEEGETRGYAQRLTGTNVGYVMVATAVRTLLVAGIELTDKNLVALGFERVI